MMFILAIMFLLGIGNFALHSAVLDSGHPLVVQMGATSGSPAAKFTLFMEFVILTGAMLGAANGWPSLAWAYAAYSGVNAVAAWLILSSRA